MASIDGVSVAKLAVYSVLILPTPYILWKHGKTGFLGWFYVQIFCILRIVTGGMTLYGNNSSTTTLILSSIGLSPLMLAITGVLHEGRRATNPRMNKKFELVLDVSYHLLIAFAMVLTVLAVVNLQKHKSIDVMKTLLRVGSALLALCWLLLTGWAFWAFPASKSPTPYQYLPARKGGRLLLKGVFISLVLTLLRVVYSIAYLQLQVVNPLSGFLTCKAVEICLSVIPEILVVVTLVTVGIITRDLKVRIKSMDDDSCDHILSDRN